MSRVGRSGRPVGGAVGRCALARRPVGSAKERKRHERALYAACRPASRRPPRGRRPPLAHRHDATRRAEYGRHAGQRRDRRRASVPRGAFRSGARRSRPGPQGPRRGGWSPERCGATPLNAAGARSSAGRAAGESGEGEQSDGLRAAEPVAKPARSLAEVGTSAQRPAEGLRGSLPTHLEGSFGSFTDRAEPSSKRHAHPGCQAPVPGTGPGTQAPGDRPTRLRDGRQGLGLDLGPGRASGGTPECPAGPATPGLGIGVETESGSRPTQVAQEPRAFGGEGSPWVRPHEASGPSAARSRIPRRREATGSARPDDRNAAGGSGLPPTASCLGRG